MSKKFMLELNEISSTQYKNTFNLIKDNNTILGLKLLIDTSDLLKKYELDEKIQFILDVELGNGKMKYYFNGEEIKPDGRYIGVERTVSLLEILKECTTQQKYNPDIKHLQVKNIKEERDKN